MLSLSLTTLPIPKEVSTHLHFLSTLGYRCGDTFPEPHRAWRHPTSFATLGLSANGPTSFATLGLAAVFVPLQHFFRGTSVLTNLGFTKLKLLPPLLGWGFSETVATLTQMFYLNKRTGKKWQPLPKIPVGFMASDRHCIHNVISYEHRSRVRLLLSKLNWLKVSSLA